MKNLKRVKRLRHPAHKMLLASAAPTGEVVMQSDKSDNSDQNLEAALAERERIGYLKGRAEAVEACWVDPANPSPESMEILARMGIGLDDSKASPFAGRKSVWGPAD